MQVGITHSNKWVGCNCSCSKQEHDKSGNYFVKVAYEKENGEGCFIIEQVVEQTSQELDFYNRLSMVNPPPVDSWVHDPWVHDPWVRDPWVRDPWVRDPWVRDPWVRDPWVRDPAGQGWGLTLG